MPSAFVQGFTEIGFGMRIERAGHRAIGRRTRRQPQRTTIPYYFVDAVVHAPFGSYPGSTPGLYGADVEHWLRFAAAQAQDKTEEYLQEWVFVADWLDAPPATVSHGLCEPSAAYHYYQRAGVERGR